MAGLDPAIRINTMERAMTRSARAMPLWQQPPRALLDLKRSR
jgi:hypothetical protein